MKSLKSLIVFSLIYSTSMLGATKNWIGTGSGAGTSDWNTAANWNPSGIPGNTDDVVIAISTANTVITFSGTATTKTINSLTMTSSGNNRTGKLDVGGNTLVITSTASFNNPSGNPNTILSIGVNGGTLAGVIDFGGNVSMTSANGVVEFIGNSNSKLIFRSNLTFGSNGAINSTTTPGSALFSSLTSQTVTVNVAAGNFTNIVVGSGTENPTVTFAGSSNIGVTSNLTVNGSSVLDLGIQTLNRSSAGGALVLNGTSTLKLSGSTGGASGSNFPNNFSTMTLSPTSTVEYNAAGGTNQTIYATPSYGHLTLSRISGATTTTKSATATLTVQGNLNISAGATFSAGTNTCNVAGNWTNNGTFTSGTSTINFNGNSSSVITGTSATSYNNITINKGTDTATTITATGQIANTGNLVLTNGLFISSNASSTLLFGSSTSIAGTAGIELNAGTLTSGGNSFTNNGLIRINGGTANFGNASGGPVTISNGVLHINGGTTTIAGRLTFLNSSYKMTGGTLNVANNTNNSSTASFDLDGTSSANITGGIIKMVNANSGTGYDISILSGTGSKSITGGTFQIGNGGSSAFKINSAIALNNVTMNSSGGATLVSNLTINNTLDFTSGKMNTGSFKVIIPVGGQILNSAATKYVAGTLEKYIAASSASMFFESGCPTDYSPVKFTFAGSTNGTGSIIIKCTGVDHPDIANSGIMANKSVNRYWTITNNNVSGFTSYDIELNFNAADIDAGANTTNFVISRKFNSIWNPTTSGSMQALKSTATGLNEFGDFQIGEPNAIAPTITCNNVNASITGCSGIVTFSQTATGIPTPTITYSQNPGTVFNVGTTPVTATATNASGSSSCTFNVIVTETTPPAFQNCPSNITTSCAGVVTWTPPTATDNCSATVTLTSNYNPGSTFPQGTTAVIYTATDDAGNAATCSFNVSVVDNSAPSIQCPSNISVYAPSNTCGENVNFSVTATDNCGATVTSVPVSGSLFPIGTTTVTSTATDATGNVSYCSFTVTVIDTVSPVINSSDVTASATPGSCGANVNYSATVTDNCSASISSSPASGTFFAIGTTMVTSTATDPSGNTSTKTFTVTVNDNQDPVITCPSDIHINNEPGSCSAVVNFNVTSTDNCSSTVTSTPASGSTFPIGTSTVTSVATDPSGNTSTCTFNVIVTDNEMPQVTCPANISVNNDAGSCGAIVNYSVTSTDNCASTVTSVPASGSLFPIGTTLVTSTATDASGNSSTCTFTVSVTDNEAPQVNCPANISTAADAGQCGAIVNFNVTVSDNCHVSSVTNPTSGSFFAIGTTTVNTTATDASGNSSNCSFTVTVSDNQSPVVTIPADITVNTDANACTASVSYNVTVTDNCSATVSTSPASGFVFPVGTTQVSSTGTDSNGNITTETFNVTVNDVENPVITCPADISTHTDAGSCGAIVNFAVIATDNCTVTVVSTPASGSYFSKGTTQVSSIATDASGNTSTCSFNVTVTDNETPVIICPSNISQTADAGVCGAIVNYNISAFDNCFVNVVSNPATGSLFPVGTTTVHASATDSAGNVSQCNFDVTVTDDELPVLNPVSNITVNTDPGSNEAIVNFSVTANDNCSANVTTNPVSGSMFQIGTTTVTSTAIDPAGNTTSTTFTVTVNDNEAPVINCPSDISVNTDAASCYAIVNYSATATDNDHATITFSPASGASFPVGTTAITATATDPSGNTTSCSFNVTVSDNEAPVAICPSNITQNTDPGQCGAIITYSLNSTDNCSSTITGSPASGSFFPTGTTTVNATATDASGNTSNCSFTVTVNDNEAPVIAPVGNITINTNPGMNTATVTYSATATDNCSATVSSNPVSGSTFPIGTTTVTITANDPSGNTSTSTFTVTVTDNESPVITCPSNINTNTDPASCGAIVNYNVTATDNDQVTIVSTPSSGSSFSVGTTTVTSVATDAAGNSSNCSFTVTVADNQAPLAICPSNIIKNTDPGQCGALVNFSLNSSDNCSSTITSVPASGSYFPTGTTTVNATATDASGNTSTCAFSVTVNDNEVPVITPHSNMTVNTNPGMNVATVTYSATATDNCSATVSSNPVSGSTFPIGTTTVTITANDPSGNTSTSTFTVTVTDNELPIITCPSNISVNTDPASCGAIVNYTVAGSDNDQVTVVSTPASGSVFPVGTTTVASTATDASGNTISCLFMVTVTDNEAPQAICPSNIMQNTNPGQCGANVNFTLNSTDNCFSTIMSNPASGSFFPTGTTTVNATAVDASGNSSTCSFTVTVVDNEAPVIAPQNNITVNTDPGMNVAIVSFNATATDNCSATVSVSHPSGSNFPIGTTMVTITATDPSGNTTTSTFSVTVNDNEAPVITCPSNINMNTDAGVCGAIVNFTVNTSDNDQVTVTTIPASGFTFPVGTTPVTSTATDRSGNVSTCSFNVVVTDNELPQVTCPSNIIKNSDPGQCGAIVNFTTSATDNCSVTSVSTPASGSFFSTGNTTVNVTATDASGNISTCSFTVTVNDNEAPAINCPSDIIVNAPSNANSATVNFSVTATDNCSATVTTNPVSGSSFQIGTTTVTATATDAAGNVSTCTFHVEVRDVTPPTIICPPQVMVNSDPAQCGAFVHFSVSSTDNQNTNLVSTPASGSFFPVGSTTVNSVASDASGNMSSCSFFVVVADGEMPVLNIPGNIVINATPGNCGTNVNYSVTATDNCSASLSISAPSGSYFPIGTTSVTAVASDAEGNVVSRSFDVTVNDIEAPSVSCPANITVSSDPNSCGAVVNFSVNAADNCTATVQSNPVSGSVFPIGTTTVTSVASDATGNTTMCSFDVTVQDLEAPAINCPANILVNATAGLCGANVNFNVTATDNCSASLTTSHTSGSFFPIGTTTVTSTASDVSGNFSTCSFQVVVSDNEVPVVNTPADITVNVTPGSCGKVVTFNVTATDNCSASLTTTPASGSNFPIGTTIVNSVATDPSGNSTQKTFRVIVIDNIVPTISTHSNMTVNATSGMCGAIVSYNVTSTDNCSSTVTTTPASGSLLPIGTTVVNSTATDASGNTASSSFTVTVIDNLAPVINNCPSDITVNTGTSNNAAANWSTPSASDNCSASLSSNYSSGSIFPLGTTVVRYTATDASGNSATCSFNVIVVDNNPPHFNNCPSNITVNTSGSCDAMATWTAPIAVDNIGATATSNYNSGMIFPIGTTTVTYTATDAANNQGTCSFTVTVVDIEIPVITNCPTDTMVIANSPATSAIVSWIDPSASDNCNYSLTPSMASGSTFPVGTTQVTYTAIDQSGNSATCTFNVTVTIATAVNEVKKSDKFVVYPNPVGGELHITITSGSKAKQYKIVSMLGAEILSGSLTGFASTINTEKLTAGTYVLEVITVDGNVSYQNIIKR